ncbi:MAG TPA: glycosyltransferase [Pirellulales bacterium]|nr:glycosyltransferase [Pirellulales bacterium]
MPSTTIVVPCHNEAQRLQIEQFRRFANSHTEVRFLFVNDGSTDVTLSLLQQLAALDPLHFEVLDLAQNGGKAEAVRQGVLQAAQKQPDYIGYWDADLATPLLAIPDFIRVQQRRPEIALVMGTRIPLLGHAIRRQPLRRWLGRVFARVTSVALGVRFYDTQCGAKLFRTTSEILAAFSQPFDSRWIFDVELLARLIRMRLGAMQPCLPEIVYEMPLDDWEDVTGSKLKRGDFFKAVSELGAIWWRYLRPAAPQFIGAPVAAETASQQPVAKSRRAA